MRRPGESLHKAWFIGEAAAGPPRGETEGGRGGDEVNFV
jgi:hypothetical protein